MHALTRTRLVSQLPEEAKRFDRIHSAFKKVMTDTARNPNVLDACTADGRLEALQARQPLSRGGVRCGGDRH